MSLIAWYPFNADVKNRGIGDSTYNVVSCTTLSNPSWTEEGKVTRRCFDTNVTSTDNSKATNYHSSKTFTPPENLSIGCWFKMKSAVNVAQHIFQIGGGDYRGSSGTDTTPVGLGIRVYGTSLYLNRNGSTPNAIKTSLTVNTWYHVMVTLEDNKTYKVYLNGDVIYTDTKVNPFASSYFVIGSLYATSYYSFYGMINDFRYYDECLSARQVKEISKGMALHFKMSKGGENIAPIYNTPGSNGGTWVKNSKSTYNHRIWDCTAASSSSNGGIYYSTSSLASSDVYTMSFDVKFTTDTNKTCLLGWEGVATVNIVSNRWYHYEKTVTLTSGHNTIFYYPQPTINDKIEVANFKIESGTVATSWIPNKADTVYSALDFDAEPDVSGYGSYCNKYGTFKYISKSPRYEGSTQFNGTEYMFFRDPIISTDTEFTISMWFNTKDVTKSQCLWTGRTNTGAAIGIHIISSQIRIDDSNMTFVNKTLSNNTWYHLAVTWKSGGNKITYINAVQVSSVAAGTLNKSNSSATIGYSSTDQTVAISNQLTGCISDVRVYKTCLSVSDVKELYDTPIVLTNTGVLMVQGEVIEK